MSKIIVLSHNRTATQSTKEFLSNLGFNCAHWGGTFIDTPDAEKMTKEELYKNLIELSKEYDAFMDIPFNHMYKEFDTHYPGSKFILITRPTNEWVKSIRNIYKSFNQNKIMAFLQHLIDLYIDNAPQNISDITDEQLSFVHDEFLNDIDLYFKERSDIIKLNMYDSELGSKIKNFIDPNLPEIEFPKIDFYISGVNK